MVHGSITNLRQLLELRARVFPEKVFLIASADGRSFTYAQFDRAVNRAAAVLRSAGIGKGDTASLLLPNSPEYIIAYFACWKIGAIAGPVNSFLKPPEMAYVISNSEARVVLVHEAFLATVQTIICGWLGFNDQDRLLTVMPLFHMNAVTVTSLAALYAAGSTVVTPRFSATRFWQTVSDYQITSFGSVATMLSMLLNKFPAGVPEEMKVDQVSVVSVSVSNFTTETQRTLRLHRGNGSQIFSRQTAPG